MRNKYPSDITRKQFQKIRPLLEKARKKTKPRTLDLYEVFCGVLYVLKSGCQWRMLPSDFPKWRSVHSYFELWSEEVEGKESNCSLFWQSPATKVSKSWLAFIELRTCSKSFSLKPQQSDTIQGIPVILHTLYAQQVPE